MTSMINQLINERLPTTPAGALALPVDLIVTGFLLALLVARLLVRARHGSGSRWSSHPLDVAAVPLVLAFGAIALGRILEIVPLG
jgi:hypothetical protein